LTDYLAFKYGNVQYPLPLAGLGLGGVGATLLRDADPALFYTLEFYQSILETHLGSRMLAEVNAVGATQIEAVVAETCAIDPDPYLTEEHFHWPLLAAYRKNTRFQWIGSTKHSVDDVEVVYVLPPLEAGEANRLLPLLKAVVSILDNRTEQGFDPLYTPTSPTGTAGESWWSRAGIVKAGLVSAAYGMFEKTEGVYFPAVTINLEITERSAFAVDTYDELERVDADIDLASTTEETVSDFVQIDVYPDALMTEGGEALLTEGGDVLEPEEDD
jgi:hypothetical protein